MLQSFESLIRAPATGLVGIFSPLRSRVKGEGESRRAQIAQLVGLNSTQLICGVGFNPEFGRIPDLVRLLGYPARDALSADRNYQFIHDRYRNLSVNDIVEIYTVIGGNHGIGVGGDASDLVISRLANLEAQLEETINPILIGGYKLEVRAIYENRLASPALIEARLDLNYSVLRDMTNESMIMLEVGAISPAEFIRHPGVTGEEKGRAIFQKLISVTDVDAYLAERPTASDAEQLKVACASAT